MNSRNFFFLFKSIVTLAESEVCIRHKIGDGTIWVQSGTNLYSLSNGIITNEVVITETCGAREVSINEDIYKTYDSATYMQTLCSELMGKASVYGTAREIQSLTFDSVAACAAYALNNLRLIVEHVQLKADRTCFVYSPGETAHEIVDEATACHLTPIKIYQEDDVSHVGYRFGAANFADCYNQVYRDLHFDFAAFKNEDWCYTVNFDSSSFTYRSAGPTDANTPAIYYVMHHIPGTCDTDSCANGSCSITLTGHRCYCNSGYTTNEDATQCVDIHECDDYPCMNAMCINTPGSYTCICNDGYEMKPNSLTECLDINECENGSNSCVNGECENTLGSYNCRCNVGYKLKEGSDRECVDINECSERLYNCTDNSDCINIAGSYKCECQEGYSLTDDKQCLRTQLTAGATAGIIVASLGGVSAIVGGVYWIFRS